MLLWLWVHCNKCQAQCNKQVWGAKTTFGRGKAPVGKGFPKLALWAWQYRGTSPRCPVPRPLLTSSMDAQGSENSASLQPGGKSVSAKWRQEELGREGNLCFQVLRGYDNKSRLGLFISPLSCLLGPAEATSYIRHVWKTRVNVDFSTSNYILWTRRLLSV